ncbi:MAG: hypothetical protein K0Q91_1710 [Fibrobacteria bacterium]|jgi:hypothetical protein|nr:hypothetical protein [Fibrobacteria bacterium]
MKKSIAILAAAALLTGCFSNDNNPTGNSAGRRPGQIQLVAMNGLAKGAVSGAASSYSFSLDTARSSFQQYFILQNTGDVEITDIELSTNNPNFTFSPSRIASLPPSEDASVVQVIKLNVVHGKRLDGLGYGNYLTPGLNTVTATIVGATIDEENETLALNESVTLTTFAKVAKFSVVAGDSSYLLTSLWHGSTFGPPMGNPSIPHYYVPVDSALNPLGEVFLKNNGNTPLTVRRWSAGNPWGALSDVVLAPDSSFEASGEILELDADGATFAPADLPIGANGKILFIVYGDL